MVTHGIIQRIEANSESILQSFLDHARRDSRLASYQNVEDQELRLRAAETVRNLGRWIAGSDDREIGDRYQALGRRRRDEGIPLAELIAKLQVLEETLLSRVQWENEPRGALDLYAELELVRRIRGFFARVTYSVIRGYDEAAMRKAS